MRFNNYIWNLYKDSKKGKETLDYWKSAEAYPNEKYAIEVKDTAIIDTLRRSDLKGYIVDTKVNFLQLRFDYLKSNYDFPKENIRELFTKQILIFQINLQRQVKIHGKGM